MTSLTNSFVKKTAAIFLALAFLCVLAPAGAAAGDQGVKVTFYWGKLKNNSSFEADIKGKGFIDHTIEGGFVISDSEGTPQEPSSGELNTLSPLTKPGGVPLVGSSSYADLYCAEYTLEPGVYQWSGKMFNGSFAGSGKFEVLEGAEPQNFYLARAQIRLTSSLPVHYDIRLFDCFGELMQPYHVESTASNVSGKNYLLIERKKGAGYETNALNDLTSSEVVGQAYKYQVTHFYDETAVVMEGLVFWPALALKSQNLVTNYCVIDAPIFQEGVATNGGKTVVTGRPLTISVPKGADVHVYQKLTHYSPFIEYPRSGGPVSDADGVYDHHSFEVPELTHLHYEANDRNFLRVNQQFFIRPEHKTFNISVDLKPLTNEYRDFPRDSDLYLNTDDSRFVELAENGTFDLFPLRVAQAQTDDIANYFAEPDYHFEVIDFDTGESQSFDSFSDGAAQSGAVRLESAPGNRRGREEYRITGVKQGLSVIKITYDAIAWGNDIGQSIETEHRNPGGAYYFNPIEPNCTGVVIVNVGGADSSGITTNIEEGEDDTIYFPDTDESVSYFFAPTSTLGEITVRVHDPLHNTAWNNGWTDYGAKPGGTSFHIKLKDGRNIVEVKSGNAVKYHTIYAKAVPVTIANVTRPGSPLQVGDTVSVHFKNLKTPIQKLSGIYNPGVMLDPVNGSAALGGYSLGNVYAAYDTDDGETIISNKTQYSIKSGATLTYQIKKPGKTVLSNGRIHCPYAGAYWTRHRTIDEAGIPPNLEAEPKGDVWHSTLPDIVLTAEAESVTETETEESPPAEDPITPITSPDDSIPVTPVTPVTPPVVDDGGEEAPAFVVQIDPEKDIKIDGDADAVTVTVSVPEGALKDGIAEAVAVAEAAGSREPTLEIRFDTPATGGSTAEPVTVKEVTVKIPISDLQAVKESPVENVKVVSGAGEVALDSGAIGELIEELLARAETEGESATTVDLVIVQTEEKLEQKADLTPEQKDALHDENALGDRKVCEVFDVSFYAGVKRIEDFKTSKGKLTIGLPYTLQNGETAEGVGVLHVQKDGNTVPMVDGRKYDEKKGLIVFQTDHLSVYAVVYEEKAKPENTGGEDAKRGESGGCDAGFASAAGAFVFLLGIALAIRRTTD